MVSRASIIAIIVEGPLQGERGATRRVARRGGDGVYGRHTHGVSCFHSRGVGWRSHDCFTHASNCAHVRRGSPV